MLLHLTLRSLIYFEFIFMYAIRKYSTFFFLYIYKSNSPTALIEETVFLIMYSCIPCHRLIKHMGVNLFPGSLFCFMDLRVFLVLVPYCFDYCSFVV